MRAAGRFVRADHRPALEHEAAFVPPTVDRGRAVARSTVSTTDVEPVRRIFAADLSERLQRAFPRDASRARPSGARARRDRWAAAPGGGARRRSTAASRSARRSPTAGRARQAWSRRRRPARADDAATRRCDGRRASSADARVPTACCPDRLRADSRSGFVSSSATPSANRTGCRMWRPQYAGS